MTSQTSPQTTETTSKWQPKKKGWLATLTIILLFLLAILMACYAWKLPPFQTGEVETNNAYVRAKTTLISSKVSGYVEEVYVQDFSTVQAGQPLVKIEQQSYLAQLDQAKANLATQLANLENLAQTKKSASANVDLRQAVIASATANLKNAQIEAQRAKTLIQQQAMSQREYDQIMTNLQQAKSNLAQAKAQKMVAEQDQLSTTPNEKRAIAAVENAQANVRLAEINLENTLIKAPTDGKVGEIGVKEGQLVNNGSQLLYLVPEEMWVIAHFKESDPQLHHRLIVRSCRMLQIIDFISFLLLRYVA